MRSASARVRLPNTPKLGPRISVDGGAPQGTKGGCDRAGEYAEGMLRAAARALTAAAGPSPRDPYRHALTMRPPQKVRPFSFFNY